MRWTSVPRCLPGEKPWCRNTLCKSSWSLCLTHYGVPEVDVADQSAEIESLSPKSVNNLMLTSTSLSVMGHGNKGWWRDSAAVFGRAVKWFVPSTNEEDSYLLPASGRDGSSSLSSQIRTPAAETSCCFAEEVPICRKEVLLPGPQVYFYLPHPYKSRNTSDSTLWRGHAIISAAEGPKSICHWASKQNVAGCRRWFRVERQS